MTTRTNRQRARRLRREAAALPGPLAHAYRRRAAELELEAHLQHALERTAVAA